MDPFALVQIAERFLQEKNLEQGEKHVAMAEEVCISTFFKYIFSVSIIEEFCAEICLNVGIAFTLNLLPLFCHHAPFIFRS